MSISLEQKKALVANLNDLASHSISAVTADYRGLTASEMDKLRVNARKVGVTLQVVRNSLARRKNTIR